MSCRMMLVLGPDSDAHLACHALGSLINGYHSLNGTAFNTLMAVDVRLEVVKVTLTMVILSSNYFS